MDSTELNNLVRHRIVSIVIKTRGASSGDEKSSRTIPQRLKGLVESRAAKDMLVVKQIMANESSQGLRIFVFMYATSYRQDLAHSQRQRVEIHASKNFRRHVLNVDLMSQLVAVFPSTKFDWKTQDEVIVDVDARQNGLSYMSPKFLIKPLRHCLPEGVFFEKTRNLMASFDNVARSAGVQKKLQSLERAVLEIAEGICEDDDVQVHIFGSRMTGLADVEKTDVDLYLQIGDTFCSGLGYEREVKLVEQFEKAMGARPDVFCKMFPLPNNYIAVLNFHHNESGLECDLNFKSGMSTTNSELVAVYLKIDPRVKYVISGIRLWMKMTELKLSYLSCAQNWLALFFLMERNVVPSVKALRNMMPASKQTFVIEGWNCAFPEKADIKWSSSCLASREELLRDFFVFYGNNATLLQSHVLDTFNGNMANKIKFMNECKMKYKSSEFDQIMRDFRGPLCILDPFVHTKNLNRFTKYCEKTYCTFVEYSKETSLMNL